MQPQISQMTLILICETCGQFSLINSQSYFFFVCPPADKRLVGSNSQKLLKTVETVLKSLFVAKNIELTPQFIVVLTY
jgi:hypothetical protein